MGDPVFKIRDLIKRENITLFSSNYAYYGDVSHRVVQTLDSMVPKIETYSIDESFLNLGEFREREVELRGSRNVLAADARGHRKLRDPSSGEDAPVKGRRRKHLRIHAHQHLQQRPLLLKRSLGTVRRDDQRHRGSGRLGRAPGRTALERRLPLLEVRRDDYGADARNHPTTGPMGRARPREKGTSLESHGQAQRHPWTRYRPHPRCRFKGRSLEAQDRIPLTALDDALG